MFSWPGQPVTAAWPSGGQEDPRLDEQFQILCKIFVREAVVARDEMTRQWTALWNLAEQNHSVQAPFDSLRELHP